MRKVEAGLIWSGLVWSVFLNDASRLICGGRQSVYRRPSAAAAAAAASPCCTKNTVE